MLAYMLENIKKIVAPKIFVDADSFPQAARDLIIRMAIKRKIVCFFVANRKLPIQKSQFIQCVQVEAGKDAADNYIGQHACNVDIILTRDLVFADRMVKVHIVVINHMGKIFDKQNMGERLSIRDFSFDAHCSGLIATSKNKSEYGAKNMTELANSLDRMLTHVIKLSGS